jgi:antitoxin ParD1/3/4
VASKYETEIKIVQDGLHALIARDRALESWLREQVGPAYDALKSNPSWAISVEAVRARLAVEHEVMTTKR